MLYPVEQGLHALAPFAHESHPVSETGTRPAGTNGAPRQRAASLPPARGQGISPWSAAGSSRRLADRDHGERQPVGYQTAWWVIAHHRKARSTSRNEMEHVLVVPCSFRNTWPGIASSALAGRV